MKKITAMNEVHELTLIGRGSGRKKISTGTHTSIGGLHRGIEVTRNNHNVTKWESTHKFAQCIPNIPTYTPIRSARRLSFLGGLQGGGGDLLINHEQVETWAVWQ